MKKLACVLALTSAFMSVDALAWGADGHRAIGSIAAKLIEGSEAEKQVAALLLPGETLESITVWADTAKGGKGYATPSPEMFAYTDANPRHNEYHYVNLPFQHTHYHADAVGTSDVDIVKTLARAIAVLQGKTDAVSNPHQFTRRQALLLIAHMSGDIHQPLHVGAAFVSKEGQFVVPASKHDVDGVNIFESRGGNSLLLDDDKITALSAALIEGEAPKLPEGMEKWKTRPFHSYWDSTVVNYAMRRISTRTPEQFAQKIIDGKPEVALNSGAPDEWPVQWANDALAVSKLAYAGVTPGARTAQAGRNGETYYTFDLEMEPNYPVPSSDLAKTQLIKGGYHLAALLQAIWP